MTKFIVGIVAIIIVLGGILYYLQKNTPAGQPQQQTQIPAAAATSSYANAAFSIVYPADFSVDPSFANTEVSEKKPIAGVKFSIPGTMATGTNLAADTFLSVEQLPRAKLCTGDIYLKQNVKSTKIADGNVTYSLATTSSNAAGNIYEEYVYALPASSPCTAVRYSIHSTDIHNYPPGTVQEFDHTKLLSIFDDIRRSLTLTSTANPSTGSTASSSLANPASASCVKAGGTLEIKDEAAGQIGYCHLPDGRVCEEWALYRDKQCVAPTQ